jgi:tRNA dimethylallyltransferase
MRAVGYRQALDHIDGRIDRATLRDHGIAATRQLAKRQLTWVRGMDVQPVDCFAADVVRTVETRVAHALEAARGIGGAD